MQPKLINIGVDMIENRIVKNATEFTQFLRDIGWGIPIAFPSRINQEGKILINTSLESNATTLDKIQSKNYIWKLWDGCITIDVDDINIPPTIKKHLLGKTMKVTSRAGHQFTVAVPEKYWEELKRPYTGLDIEGIKVDTLTPILRIDKNKGYTKDNIEDKGEGRGAHGPGSFKINKKEEIEKDLPRNKKYDTYNPDDETHYILEGDNVSPIMCPDEICELLIEAIKKQKDGKTTKVVKKEDSQEYVKITRLPDDKLVGDDNGKNHDILNSLEMICRGNKLDFASSMEILWEANQKCMVKPSSDEKLFELKTSYAKERESKGVGGQYQVLRVGGGMDDVTMTREAMKLQGWIIKEDDRKRSLSLILRGPHSTTQQEVSTNDANVIIRNALKSGIKLFSGQYVTDPKTNKILPKLSNFKVEKGIVQDVIAQLIIEHKEDPIYKDVFEVLLKDAQKIVDEKWDDKNKRLDDSDFVHKYMLKEIISFDPNPNLNVNYPKLCDEYNEWAVFMVLFPAVYNTMEAYKKMKDPHYNPMTAFGAIGAFIGGEGCFKSTWIPALMRHLPLIRGQSYYVPIDLKTPERNLLFLLESSFMTEIQEGRGLNADVGQTKSFLGRTDDFIQHYYSDRPFYAPRRNGFYITSNVPTLFDVSDDPQRRYATFFVSQLLSLTEEAEREMPENPERYHIMKLDAWAKKYARRVFAELLAYYLIGRVPGLPSHLHSEREKAFEHSDGTVKFEEDLLEVLKIIYDIKKGIELKDDYGNEVEIKDEWMLTNYDEIQYRLEKQPFNYSRESSRKDKNYYTNNSIKKAYKRLTGLNEVPDNRYQYVRLTSHGASLYRERGIHFNLLDRELQDLMKDESDPLKDMDNEDQGNIVTEEVIQKERLDKKLKEEREKGEDEGWIVDTQDDEAKDSDNEASEDPDDQYFKGLANGVDRSAWGDKNNSARQSHH